MSYTVYVTVYPIYPWEETIEGEYTGTRHKTRKAAEMELKTAKRDPEIRTHGNAYIKETV